MNYSYKSFFQNVYRLQGQRFAFRAATREEALEWQQGFREALRESLGLNRLAEIAQALKDTPAEERVTLVSEVPKEGFLLKKYVLQTLPEVCMPFYMLIPDGADRAHPARGMITIPAHGANKNTVCGVGETQEELAEIASDPESSYGKAFAKQGYVVFCPDPPGYGERTEPLSSEDRQFLPGREKSTLESSCKDLSQTAEALGFSLIALEIWDLMRLLDFACRCEEVVKQNARPRIGCAGFSGGGQYAMWLSALDERIALAVVSGYVHGYYDSILDCHLCPCNYAPNLWTLGDISDICSLIAPRPLFVENGTQDIENGPRGIDGPRDQVGRIMKIYQLFAAQEHLWHSTPDGPHKWYGSCYGFVDESL